MSGWEGTRCVEEARVASICEPCKRESLRRLEEEKEKNLGYPFLSGVSVMVNCTRFKLKFAGNQSE